MDKKAENKSETPQMPLKGPLSIKAIFDIKLSGK